MNHVTFFSSIGDLTNICKSKFSNSETAIIFDTSGSISKEQLEIAKLYVNNLNLNLNVYSSNNTKLESIRDLKLDRGGTYIIDTINSINYKHIIVITDDYVDWSKEIIDKQKDISVIKY